MQGEGIGSGLELGKLSLALEPEVLELERLALAVDVLDLLAAVGEGSREILDNVLEEVRPLSMGRQVVLQLVVALVQHDQLGLLRLDD